MWWTEKLHAKLSFSDSAGPVVSSCGRQRAEVPVTFITEQQNWRRRRHLWQPRSCVVVGGAFRTAYQRQSTGLERFIAVTYCWDGPVIVTVTLSETAWFHRGQVSQQKRQHLHWQRTTNCLRLTLKPTCYRTNVSSSTNSRKLCHRRERSVQILALSEEDKINHLFPVVLWTSASFCFTWEPMTFGMVKSITCCELNSGDVVIIN